MVTLLRLLFLLVGLCGLFVFLARPSNVASTSVTSPLTIRDWLIKGALVAPVPAYRPDSGLYTSAVPAQSTLDIADVPSTEVVVHTGTTPHVELWSDLIGSCPVSANG